MDHREAQHLRDLDANIERNQACTQFVREELHDKLELGDTRIVIAFRIWLLDDPTEFAEAMLNTDDGKTRQEVIHDWRDRWIDYLLSSDGAGNWQTVATAYRLNVT